MATVKYNNTSGYLPAQLISTETLILQGRGVSTTSVMSQKAVSDELYRIDDELISLNRNKLEKSEAEAKYQPKGDYLTAADITDKANRSEIPTKLSELEDDKNYLTAHQSLSDYYTKKEVDAKLTFDDDVVDSFTRVYVRKSELQDCVDGYAGEYINKNYYTKEEVDDKLGIIGDDIDSLDFSPYLTKEDAEKIYIKEHQSLEDYALKTDIIEYDDSEIKSRLATLEDIDHDLFLTEHQSLKDYYTKDEVDSKLLYKSDTDTVYDDTYLKGKLQNLENAVDQLKAYDDSDLKFRLGKLEEINHELFLREWPDLSEYVKQSDFAKFTYDDTELTQRIIELEDINHQIYALKTDLGDTERMANRYTDDKVDDVMDLLSNLAFGESGVTLTNYYTKDEIDNKLENIEVSETYDDTEIKSRISSLEEIDHTQYATVRKVNELLDGYATTGYVSDIAQECARLDNTLADKADKSSVYSKSETDIKISEAVESIEEYDDTDIKNRITTLEAIDHSQYLTEHQSLANYYTKNQVDTKISEAVADVDVDLSDYALKSEIPDEYDDTALAARVATLEAIDHSQYLTAHQSLSNYYTKTQVDSKLGDIQTILTNIIG